MPIAQTDGPIVLNNKTTTNHRGYSILITIVFTAIGLLLIAASLIIADRDSGEDQVSLRTTPATVAVLGLDVDVGDIAEGNPHQP